MIAMDYNRCLTYYWYILYRLQITLDDSAACGMLIEQSLPAFRFIPSPCLLEQVSMLFVDMIRSETIAHRIFRYHHGTRHASRLHSA